MVLGSTYLLTNEYQESSWGIKGGWAVRKADHVIAVCEQIVKKLWQPPSLTTK
jgi:hypothetical protein